MEVDKHSVTTQWSSVFIISLNRLLTLYFHRILLKMFYRKKWEPVNLLDNSFFTGAVEICLPQQYTTHSLSATSKSSRGRLRSSLSDGTSTLQQLSYWT